MSFLEAIESFLGSAHGQFLSLETTILASFAFVEKYYDAAACSAAGQKTLRSPILPASSSTCIRSRRGNACSSLSMVNPSSSSVQVPVDMRVPLVRPETHRNRRRR